MDTEDKKCVVCLEYSTTQTDCHHTLCGACWNRLHTSVWGGRQTPKCPYCRKDNIDLTIPIELTEEEKREHYDTLLEYYNERTKILPNPPPPVYQPAPRPAPVPARPFAPVRIPEGQGLPPEPPRQRRQRVAPNPRPPAEPQHVVVRPRARWNEALPQMANYLLREHYFRNVNNDNALLNHIKYVGFEANPLLLALPDGYAHDHPDRHRAIKASTIQFIVRAATIREDIAIMNSVFNVRLPATQKTTIYLEAGILPEAIPFNCRPMNSCKRCHQRRTRRICPRCEYTSICQHCGDCGAECRQRWCNGGYYYIDLLPALPPNYMIRYNQAVARYDIPPPQNNPN